MGGRRCSGRLLLAGLLIATVAVTAPGTASAAPPPPPPGPPPSEVLAVDPSTVSPPDLLTTLATTCPAAPFGIQNSAPGGGKTVALTFDDGPGASTEAVLRILEDAGVAATFFDVGVNQTVRPEAVFSAAQQGFLLGNHTWSHPNMTTLSTAAQAAQMDDANAQHISIVGAQPCFFRPPYGAANSTTLSLAQSRRMAVFNWSVDTEDWMARGSASSFWVNRIISRAQAGGSQSHPVVLMHTQPGGNPATVAALPSIITFYRDRGYVFVDLAGRVLDRAVTGDWDGNGTTTPGVVRGNTWYLRNSNSSGPADVVFRYGGPSDRVVTGDWDGNGTTTPGIVRGNRWYLRNSNSAGPGTVVFDYGGSSDRVVTGDWDGNGTTTPGVVRGSRWYLRNSNSTGPGTIAFDYGSPSDRVITGDWDGNRTTTPGIVRGSTWHLRNANSGGPGTVIFGYGGPTDRIVSGDWDGNRTETPGVVRGTRWHLRNVNSSGPGTVAFTFGP